MSDLAIAGVSLLAGIIATVVVSRYYFRRTVSKAITPYVLSHSDVLGDIDAVVRDALKVQYHGVEVTSLTDIQLLIANTGERAIRDEIEPLSLHLPREAEVLDAKVLHVEPAGRAVDVAVVGNVNGGSRVNFLTPLLNRGEFFIVRLFVKGSVAARDLRFTIVAEDLPPQLNLEWLFSWKTATQEKRRFDPVLLAFGTAVLSLPAGLFYLLYVAWSHVAPQRHGTLGRFESPATALRISRRCRFRHCVRRARRQDDCRCVRWQRRIPTTQASVRSSRRNLSKAEEPTPAPSLPGMRFTALPS